MEQSQRSTIRAALPFPGRLDRRSRAVKRWRAVVADLVEQMGGAAAVTGAQLLTIQRIATYTLEAEKIEAQVLRGEAINRREYRQIVEHQQQLLNSLDFPRAPRSDYYYQDAGYYDDDSEDEAAEGDKTHYDNQQTEIPVDPPLPPKNSPSLEVAGHHSQPPQPENQMRFTSREQAPSEQAAAAAAAAAAVEENEKQARLEAEAARAAEKRQIQARYRFLQEKIQRGNQSQHLQDECEELQGRWRELQAAEAAEQVE